MFGLSIDDATSVFCDNKTVYENTVLPESTLNKEHHSISYHRCRETVIAKTIWVAREGAMNNLADLFTKIMSAARRTFLLDKFTY